MNEAFMSVAPQLAPPVTRQVTGTVASSDDGVEQSVFNIEIAGIPFAGDDEE
ncbi:MAG TPA: hypothetical protein VGR06_11805 [Actinophytocola sp.]|jgi:prenylated cyclic peptide (anacyclamide/piricyclamide family)|uniref:hypothetical protein n=1 Tax=Actinophytocola sp. TaxID=1872138 RepID=UPI002E0CAAF2|nr:hypothetical protein [Actinophytocola sp.]